MDDIREWDQAISCFQLPAPQKLAVDNFWKHCRGFPLPRVEGPVSEEPGVRFSYSIESAFLECEIYPSGLCDWFFTDFYNPIGDDMVEVPIDIIIEKLIERFEWIHEKESETH